MDYCGFPKAMNAIRNKIKLEVVEYSTHNRMSYKLTLRDDEQFECFEIFLEGTLAVKFTDPESLKLLEEILKEINK